MSDLHTSNPNSDQPAHYVIHIQGQLGPQWAGWFEGMTFSQDDAGDTIITGLVTDQAALYGLLRRVRDLGLPLISVIRSDASDGDPSSNTSEENP